MPIRLWFSALIAGLVLTACGAQPHSAAPGASTVADAFKGSPPALAAVHAQANELLHGGREAFAARLATLRGFPIVINKWASWCGPCRTEFPVFQRSAVAFGRQVAFLGLNGKDSDQSAAAFLKQFPVTYPSYVDPNETIAATIKASTYYPLTVYIDPQGKIVFVHDGAYENAATLERDIRHYVLGGR